ncbi:hypothetical protein GGTG_08532 [Gaeumannomyces tritici R3-111a-1]|uniref:ubiquitinyl hydrolase 1 n=1 Tax=Gaeumannomyces tritici (strain R3-111a-1) TaxID=644352 RepID=J3P4U6_GAET3|nr:hypothetical protein GGTG_08532 [Gaeumannomyces tritici R3-111a-1]EJT74694.1 hypothetical protein GGTG_08532 [Gaeumannomyces tritici R3-111a-1]
MSGRESEEPGCSPEERKSIYVVNHLFFPPQLPGENDWDAGLEAHLLSTLYTSLESFVFRHGASFAALQVLATVSCMQQAVAADGSIDADRLSAILRGMCTSDTSVALNISEQNAAVIITRKDQEIYIEAFELSPRNEDTMASPGRLRRQFPDVAVAVPFQNLLDDQFRKNLIHVLSTLSQQAAPDTIPQVWKAGQFQDEERDTADPKWVTEWLFTGVLGAESRPVTGQSIWKNVRDSVHWDESLMPWRRSSTWLLARVALQLAFSRLSRSAEFTYKNFMLFFAASVLEKTPRGASGGILQCVDGAMSKATAELEKRQKCIFSLSSPDSGISQLESLDFSQHVLHHLPDVDKFIKYISTHKKSGPHAAFSRKSCPEEFEPGTLPSLSRFASSYATFTLAAFEKWVADHLDSWIAANASYGGTCRELQRLLEYYEQAASAEYSGNPEGGSTLVLTALELWVACDKSATALTPLLKEYDPQIPAHILQLLVLPFREQMGRLGRVELYLRERCNAAKSSLPDIFLSFGARVLVGNCVCIQTFAVGLYYAQSQRLRELHCWIDKDATRQRERKVSELHHMQRRYEVMKRENDRRTCYRDPEWSSRLGEQPRNHADSCVKCSTNESMENMRIDVHEWPLPRHPRAAEATIFELCPPPSFGSWRDSTMFVRTVIFGGRYAADGPKMYKTLLQYPPLSRYAESPQVAWRISPASDNKPSSSTHRRHRHMFGLTRDDVCINNGMPYAYHDNEQHQFVQEVEFHERDLLRCAYRLPDGAAWLGKYLFRPSDMPEGLPPNSALANQHEAPDSMGRQEFVSLVSVPLGHKIQWQNILCELVVPCVDFRKEETAIVLFQAMYQAGPSTEGSDLREGHQVLDDVGFCHRLVAALREAAGRVGQNWEASRALANFVSIATRVLSLSSDTGVHDACLGFLGEARLMAVGMLRSVRANVESSAAAERRFQSELLDKTAEVCLVCIATFDVEEHHLRSLLGRPEDASVFVRCSIDCHEALADRDPEPQGTLLSLMALRWKRVCVRARACLSDMSTAGESGGNGLDDAVRQCWPEYNKCGRWKPLQTPLGHWLETSPTSGHGRSLNIKFNLLTAELLVDGLSLSSRLPAEYKDSKLYSQLFGKGTVHVTPANVPGMEFALKAEVSGYAVSMGFSASYGLLVRAKHCASGVKYQIIPQDCFRGVLPSSLVKDYTHWYDPTRNVVEFRPVQASWRTDEDSLRDGWILSRGGADAWELRQGDRVLVPRHSVTVKAISAVLEPIEDAKHLRVSVDTATEGSGALQVDVPRLRLQFSLEPKSQKLYSKQFRGMWVDATTRSVGALMGLKSKLLLVNDRNSHMLLIPDGEVEWTRESKGGSDPEGSRHVVVRIKKGTSSGCRAYRVDPELRRLTSDGSFRSKIYLAYLHAITSFPTPDPLTAHTGTEQALSILRSAAVRSLHHLNRPDCEILLSISKLTAPREFYPAHLKDMQQVSWRKDLGFLSQHSQLYLSVESLLRQAQDQKELYRPDDPERDLVDKLPWLSQRLLEYDLVNSAWCRAPGFGAEDFTADEDRVYIGRGRDWRVPRANACFATTRAINEGRPFLPAEAGLLVPGSLQVTLWHSLLPAGTINGPRHLRPSPGFDTFDFAWIYDSLAVLVHFCRLHRTLSNSTVWARYEARSWLSAMVFAANTPSRSSQVPPLARPILRVLEACLSVPAMSRIRFPDIDQFQVDAGYRFDASSIQDIVYEAAYDYWDSPEARLARLLRETNENLDARREEAYEAKMERLVGEVVSALQSQWPCASPTIPFVSVWRMYICMENVQAQAQQQFETWYANHLLFGCLGQIAQLLESQRAPARVTALRQHPTSDYNCLAGVRGFVTTDDVFALSAPPQPTSLRDCPLLYLPNAVAVIQPSSTEAASPPRVNGLVKRIQMHAKSDFTKRYAKDLGRSACALRHVDISSADMPLLSQKDLEEARDSIRDYLARCRSYRDQIYAALESVLGLGGWAAAVSPRICPEFFLSQLAPSRWKSTPSPWKPVLISYALSHHDIQRAERLLLSSGSVNSLYKELRNAGHQNWSPCDHPAALLMEVESKITIREVQSDIARQMINHPNGQNSVLQLNMGEGKSTVIVPMVATALADGNRLVRVIVAKAQAPQMRQMLLSKLGGLLDIKIHQLPISRDLRLGSEQVGRIARDLAECRDQGGVLLVQPEHLLSLKLMGLERLIEGGSSSAHAAEGLVWTQRMLDLTSRDVVDESDEVFNVRFEQVYTIGTQRPVDFGPDRWHVLLSVLTVARDVASDLARKSPLSFASDDVHGPGSFPRLRFFDRQAQGDFINAIAERICQNGLPRLPITRRDPFSSAALMRYLTKSHLTPEEVSAQKRWRVDYGFDPRREPPTRLAVPYRAKDCPSARSEFSHPEVAMLLTALSSYHGGLSDDDLALAFARLLRSDRPGEEYEGWVRDAEALAPPELRHLDGVNLSDRVLCTQQLFPSFRHAKATVDFFLSRVVFPRYMREFPSKLSASGWDLGEQKAHPTTGFSGTNDSRELLPLSVKHLDLSAQCHTNSLVLEYLLRDENDVTIVPARAESPAVSDAELLLKLVVEMPHEVQVILDVGAQILELENHEVARQWLKMESERNPHRGKKACVFVDVKDNVLQVVDLEGHTEPLQTSPFGRQLDACLVFLDQAHTRGTDLKLPSHYRAALTLGANLTKDRLAQAAMRMRGLGEGQAVTFCVPQEIKGRILQRTDERRQQQQQSIGVMDVLQWAILETFDDMERAVPLWAVQGQTHAHQQSVYSKAADGRVTEQLAQRLLQKEAQTVEDLYRASDGGSSNSSPCCADADRHPDADRIERHRASFFGDHVAAPAPTAALGREEERQRELAPEVEQERRVEQRAPAAEAARHALDPAVVHFARTGELPRPGPDMDASFPPAFLTIGGGGGGQDVLARLLPRGLRCSRDFARTVAAGGGGGGQEDRYQRPVRWVLTTGAAVAVWVVLVSPFEAQALLPLLRPGGAVVLHAWAGGGGAASGRLLLHARPPPPPGWSCPLELEAQLDVFAGLLAISSYDEYKTICALFGLGGRRGAGEEEEEEGVVSFLKALMTKVRRDCESVGKTHVGRMLDGVALSQEDFGAATSPPGQAW